MSGARTKGSNSKHAMYNPYAENDEKIRAPSAERYISFRNTSKKFLNLLVAPQQPPPPQQQQQQQPQPPPQQPPPPQPDDPLSASDHDMLASIGDELELLVEAEEAEDAEWVAAMEAIGDEWATMMPGA